MRELIIKCDCGGLEHLLELSYDPDEPDYLFIVVLLHSYVGFWRRFLMAIRHIFGYKSRYGNMAEIVIEDATEMIEFLQKYERAREWVNQSAEGLQDGF